MRTRIEQIFGQNPYLLPRKAFQFYLKHQVFFHRITNFLNTFKKSVILHGEA